MNSNDGADRQKKSLKEAVLMRRAEDAIGTLKDRNKRKAAAQLRQGGYNI